MDFIDRIRELSAKIPRQIEHILTEEATKHALVMPFINALGYSVFDPDEVIPEFTADVGTKRGEKVDYAIIKDGKPIILIECKPCGTDLDKEHASQLYRYFSVTEAKFGVLTNGVMYRFYTDLEQPNKMDTKPFLEFNMLDIKEPTVEELKKFTKGTFDLEGILATASELKYTKEIKRILLEQLSNPSEDFVRFFVKQVYDGLMTKAVREQFEPITKRAFQQFISDRISDRLKSALAEETASTSQLSLQNGQDSTTEEAGREDRNIYTSQEEHEGYYIVKAILREVVDVRRVAVRDTKSYCGILLDDTNRKPICRLHFNRSQKYLGLFKEEKQEERIPIDNIDDIYKYADKLKATLNYYENQQSYQPSPGPSPENEHTDAIR